MLRETELRQVMAGKYGSSKITNSSGGQPSLELCHQWQCSASTCAGFAGGKELSEDVQGPYRHSQPVLTCMIPSSWSGVSSSELLQSDHCVLCPGVSETPDTCLMVLCSMFQWASWTERKVGHWYTRRNRKTSDIRHYYLSYYKMCYSFALLEAGRRQRPGLLPCCCFGGSFAFQNKMQQFHGTVNVKMICMNFTQGINNYCKFK